MSITTAEVNRLKQLRADARRKTGPTHASQLSAADQDIMRKALATHIANGTATPNMLRLAKLHGVSV